MCGAGSEVSRGDQRKALLSERDARILQFMEQQRPVAVIAELEGLDEDYARKATRRIAAEYGINYDPGSEVAPPELFTDDTRAFRNSLADALYDLRKRPDAHPLSVARDTGLQQSQQVAATERGGLHDWKLSQLGRLARARGESFKFMMLQRLLTPEEFTKVWQCLNS